MKSIIINLDRNPERKDYMIDLMKNMPYIQYEFLSGIDGIKYSDEALAKEFDTDKFRARYVRNPSKGDMGCRLSHNKCYEHIIENNLSAAIIFEDDVTIKYDIEKLLVNTEPLYLCEQPVIVLMSGWFWFSKKKIINNVNYGIVKDGFLAQAYIINKKAAEVILNEKPYLVADDWNALAKKGIKIYGIIPHAFDQNWGEFNSGIKHDNRVNKGYYFSKIRIYYREILRKINTLLGKFESCDYLTKK